MPTPHTDCHFVPSHPAYQQPIRRRRRFMEGWYYRLTIPDVGSFAIIVSNEDPGRPRTSLACIQVVGPHDQYLVQADRDATKFWAEKNAFGCVFAASGLDPKRTELGVDEWNEKVDSGFQIRPSVESHAFLGRIRGHDGTLGGVLDGQGVPGTCDFDFSVRSLCGWGDSDQPSKSTGGWLASFRVFEPHWQVTMADGRATGVITWMNTTYDFVDAPFYAEKNWGAALPPKWYWTQCNAFEGYDQLSVTAGGGIRTIPFGRKESLGMIGVHYDGTFFEAVPWTGNMEWEVETWGSWKLRGNSTLSRRPFAVELEYSCDQETGLVFRAPTPDEGMVYFCRDTFEANTTLTLWELESDGKEYMRKEPPLIDRARSTVGGAEVGGGPWWSTWKRTSSLKQPIRFLLRVPVRVSRTWRRLRGR